MTVGRDRQSLKKDSLHDHFPLYVRELARLNDRELADIGITRSEISAVAWANARAA
jgi:hypothetical protein